MFTQNDTKMDIDPPETSTHYSPLFRTLSGMPQNAFHSNIIKSFLRECRDNPDAPKKIQTFFNALAKLIGDPTDLTQPHEGKIHLFAIYAKEYLEDLCVPLLNYFSNNGPIHPKNKEFLAQYIKGSTSAPMEVEDISTPTNSI